MMQPGNVGKRHFDVNGVTGLDFFVQTFLPSSWAARLFAKKLVRSMGPPGGPGEFTFGFAGRVWEITDAKGHVRAWNPNS